jgi:PII-like signaling protein
MYLTEGEGLMQEVLGYLHDEIKVRGVTVFRGITGFGRSGKFHSSTLIDMSLDLPLVIEFFDEPTKIEAIVSHWAELTEPGHVVWWSARANVDEKSR